MRKSQVGMNGPLEQRKRCLCQESVGGHLGAPLGTFRRSALSKYLSISPPQNFDQHIAHWQFFSAVVSVLNLAHFPVLSWKGEGIDDGFSTEFLNKENKSFSFFLCYLTDGLLTEELGTSYCFLHIVNQGSFKERSVSWQ